VHPEKLWNALLDRKLLPAELAGYEFTGYEQMSAANGTDKDRGVLGK
jgi:hypothetical protein